VKKRRLRSRGSLIGAKVSVKAKGKDRKGRNGAEMSGGEGQRDATGGKGAFATTQLRKRIMVQTAASVCLHEGERASYVTNRAKETLTAQIVLEVDPLYTGEYEQRKKK